MKIIKTYKDNAAGRKQREKAEQKLFSEGWAITSEEETKDWNGGKACCLAVIFLPLALFGQSKMVKVTYEK